MNKNYIAEFMKDNDLEFGEEFGIDGITEFYHFGSDYILYSSSELEVPNKFRCLLSGELKIKKLPKREYVEVDNNVPRFTEIEVRNSDDDEWSKRLFLFKVENSEVEFPYCVITKSKDNTTHYRQARMLKPSEPEFKEGELIEVRGIDDGTWVKRQYLGKLNEFYMCKDKLSGEPYAWKYARKIEGK